MKNIILTGFMGAGKSTVGRLLATRMGREFVDTDELVIQMAGKTIPAIFEEDGEPAFRAWEAATAAQLAERNNLVIGTGGGLMLNANNVAALRRNGVVFCLTAAPETLLDRIRDDGAARPLLAAADPAGRIAELLQDRRAAYAQFTQIPTDGRAPGEIADAVLEAFKHRLPARLTVTHPSGRYDVFVGHNLLHTLRDRFSIPGQLVVVTDSNVGLLYAPRIAEPDTIITIPAGEAHKTLATATLILNEMLDAGFDRQTTVVALGGGVVGDVAGFAAATFLRGVNVIQCPTSLLAMVDASVGGKTGVDMPQGKNLVGAFKQPLGVLADLDTLATLPRREQAAGMAEAIKSGLIADPALFESTESSALPDYGYVVPASIRVKRDIVESDPFEQGRRAVLNLGHTFAHAIERVTDYGVGHGEAVAMGLVAAARLSALRGDCAAVLVERIIGALNNVGLPGQLPAGLNADVIYQAMFSDKKKRGGRLRFVLLRDVGSVFVASNVARDDVITAIRQCQSDT